MQKNSFQGNVWNFGDFNLFKFKKKTYLDPELRCLFDDSLDLDLDDLFFLL
jgi:hypothetical protein